ncbi:MAG: restriction endonuclease [Bacteroidetes bacterium]|nr:restriction endonuclease [Bacteroidota bacterium]
MAIPKFDELRISSLKLLANGSSMKLKEFISPIAQELELTQEEVNQMYPSGNANIFYDRISWALSYLYMSGLVEKPSRGVYKISQKGLEILEKGPEFINEYVDNEIAKREPVKRNKLSEVENVASKERLTPQEELYSSFDNIRDSIYNEILTTILSKTPQAFEKLVVHLLQKMGYGGEIKNSGIVTKYSNDGGIDGIIKEDILGFGRINIQAKRYQLENSVSRAEIQKFVGALATAQSNKGVFITTSYFTKGAIEYVENLFGNATIVLIDGKDLARYIYDFGLGMQIEQTIQIKKLDSDFWDEMPDEIKK